MFLSKDIQRVNINLLRYKLNFDNLYKNIHAYYNILINEYNHSNSFGFNGDIIILNIIILTS